MELTPREKDKLLLFTAALLAERRKERGLKLNYPEAVAYISAAIMEGARDGRSVAELMDHGRTLLTRDDLDEAATRELGDRRLDLLAGLRAHVGLVVEHPRHGLHRHARKARNVFNSNGHQFPLCAGAVRILPEQARHGSAAMADRKRAGLATGLEIGAGNA